MTVRVEADPGSFRDPSSRVFEIEGRIVRGLDEKTAADFAELEATGFYRELLDGGAIVETRRLSAEDPIARAIRSRGWSAAVEHTRLPLISYPYEWPFSMLKDAALLHLHLLEAGFAEGWTLKDATPYNVQFVGAAPVFIDVPSFVRRAPNEPWLAYRQFCMLFLYPLMLKAHLGIDFQGALRADLDGLTPVEAARYFLGSARFKKGVLSHVIFPAAMERRVEAAESDRAPARKRSMRQSDLLVRSLLSGMRRLVEALDVPLRHTAWSQYAKLHSYEEQDVRLKEEFVRKWTDALRPDTVWDLGGNTGAFSRICSEYCNRVVTVDGDYDSVEALYWAEKRDGGRKILPLVMNLANISPSQGWGGKERAAFDQRNRPKLVLCLALIHHMALAANVPISLFLGWLATLGANVIIEFVDRRDEMVTKLLANKTERYPDYHRNTFESELGERFLIRDSIPLKGGLRQLYYCETPA
ncbi:hypothetical protein [Arvimicrobium flavum]|uniref:hypothetical protein n=1 Tax=Arvimicrobium flavum TaxID=3393320 RepID=UPI00237BFF19|nr:hypothetical protein [Mesorhizobium shangrilense]